MVKPCHARKNAGSLRTSVRLSLQFSFLYAVLSACVFALAYVFTQNEVQGWVRDQMRGDAHTFQQIYETDGVAGLTDRVDALSEVSFEKTRLYQVQDDDGRVLAGNLDVAMGDDLPARLDASDPRLNIPARYEVDVYWMRQDQIGPYRLVQGAGDHLIAEILEALAGALVLGYLSVIILGLIVGVRVGRITEQRITAISATLADVSAGRLAARVPLSPVAQDDLSRVSGSINAMLDQIMRLLESQQQISNDIAHDMRTPLQRLRQRLERMGDGGAIDPDDVQACQRQTDDIIATFNALLRIAQIEASNRHARFEMVDLGQILSTVAEVFEPAADEAEITLFATLPDHPLTVTGDGGLLTQLFSNLVENAIRHCPSGTTVTLTACTHAQVVIVRVADTGPGIAHADRDRILRRFFRVESSRHTSGHGLGLALVKAIAEMHDATITVQDGHPGSVFEIRFG